MPASDLSEVFGWKDRTVIGSDGEKIGKISEIFLDEWTNEFEWATVTTGLFGTKSFVPLAGASPQGEDVHFPVTKAQVEDAPQFEDDQELSEQEERRLYEHYGVPYTTEGSTTAQGSPGGGEGASRGGQRDTGDAMTRSEEELRVGTRQREAGRARLRKYVATEQVEKTVPVRREEVRVERDSITEANPREGDVGGRDL